MKLDEYLTENKITSYEFAEQLGCSQAQVHKLRKGQSGISIGLASKIDKATGGKVSMHDFAEARPEQRKR